MRKEENKNYRSVSFLPDVYYKIPKKLKKLKNIIMTSFQAKNRLERPRKREKKNYRSVPFHSYPTGNRKFPKNNKKIQKIKKSQFGLILRQNSSEKDEKERK